MALTEKAKEVVRRPLPADKIKSRQGKAGMTYDYIPPHVVIDLLNEAFDYDWTTRILDKQVQDSTVVVLLELSVPNDSGGVIVKTHFGSCEITRGLGVGDAFKGAASDAMKKCATLLGLGLELYKDEDVTTPGTSFTSPPRNNIPRPSTIPAVPTPPPPPRFQPPVPSVPTPPAPPKGSVPPPFPPRPSGAGQAPLAPPKRQANPFAGESSGGINSTHLNSLTNIALRKNLNQAELIALAGIVDEHGKPIGSFEELNHQQAIQVIQVAQR